MRFVPLLVCVTLFLCWMPFVAGGDDEKKSTEVDGTWKLTQYIENGKPNEDEVKANYRVVRKDGVQEITRDGKPYTRRKFEVDPAETPKHIDFLDDKGTRVCGVYEIKGDVMRLAILADPEKRKTGRPGDLKEEGNDIAVYERVKDN